MVIANQLMFKTQIYEIFTRISPVDKKRPIQEPFMAASGIGHILLYDVFRLQSRSVGRRFWYQPWK